MTKRDRKTAASRAAGVLLLLSAVAQVSFAGDEDISPSAYQIFDPETGYMIPADPQNSQQSHGPSSEDARDDGAAADAGSARRYWPYLLFVLLVLGAIVLRYWRSKMSRTV